MNMPGADDNAGNQPQPQNEGRRGSVRRKLGKIFGQ
jgi:hypothetical protein